MENITAEKVLTLLSDGLVHSYDFYFAITDASDYDLGLEDVLITDVKVPKPCVQWEQKSDMWGHASPSFSSSSLEFSLTLTRSNCTRFLQYCYGCAVNGDVARFVPVSQRPTITIYNSSMIPLLEFKSCTISIPSVPDLNFSSSDSIKLSLSAAYEDVVINRYYSMRKFSITQALAEALLGKKGMSAVKGVEYLNSSSK